MMKKSVSLLLALALALGLTVPVMAYSTPDFSDVPLSHWAYEAVMKMADAGVIKGTGNGQFSPDMKLSAEMFVVLVGRVVFPEVKAEGADWSGPYVSEAKAQGLLDGTNVSDSNLKGEISRYDMAVILAKCVEILKVSAAKADQSKVADFGDVPNQYADAVLTAYGSGLIRGDQNGNFNGANNMTRQEAATVMDRLLGLKGPSSQGETTEPEQPVNSTYSLRLTWDMEDDDGILILGEQTFLHCTLRFDAEGSAYPSYGLDRSGFILTNSNPAVVQVERSSDGEYWSLTALALGTSTITVTDPYGVSASVDITVVATRAGVGMKSYTICVRPARYRQHTIRGNAYTHSEIVPDVAYKVYHTRDGGKTSQLVYEGVAPIKGGSGTLVNVELPEDAFYSKDAGFYISAEGELDGQRLVTSDLRTDGRSYITLVDREGSAWITGTPHEAYELEIELTPPEGEKSHFTFKGYVRRDGTEGTRISGATIQLYHKDGALVGETVSRADGTFEMECEVDALDGGFNKSEALYRVVAWGQDDAGHWGVDGIRPSGSQVLWSLVDLHIAPILDQDGPGDGNYRLVLDPRNN